MAEHQDDHKPNWPQKVANYLRSKPKKDESQCTWYLPPEDDDMTPPQYATWPAERLQLTLHDAIARSGITNPETISNIEMELNDKCPFDIKDQYDFCVVCPQVDYYSAQAMKNELCNEFDLVGSVLWECLSLGMDLSIAFEDILSRSTKVLFYVSENYNEYDFCCHLAKNYLMQQTYNGTERTVVPILTNAETKVPERLQLVDRLVLNNKLQFRFRFPAIFTDAVKQKKIIRKLKSEQEIDEKRKSFIYKLVEEKVNQVNGTDYECNTDAM